MSSQTKKIEVLKIDEIDFYRVYKVIDYESPQRDTLLLLGCKPNNEDFKNVYLEVGKKYKVETRLNSRIKISEDKYMFCSPGITIINKIPISKKSNLPILILDYEQIYCLEKHN